MALKENIRVEGKRNIQTKVMSRSSSTSTRRPRLAVGANRREVAFPVVNTNIYLPNTNAAGCVTPAGFSGQGASLRPVFRLVCYSTAACRCLLAPIRLHQGDSDLPRRPRRFVSSTRKDAIHPRGEPAVGHCRPRAPWLARAPPHTLEPARQVVRSSSLLILSTSSRRQARTSGGSCW